MTVEEAVRESLATAGGAICISAGAGRTGEAVQQIRAAGADFVLLLIDSPVPALDRAMLIGAIGPLAIELAPRTRIGAIDIAVGADRDDVVAAACFLAAAGSTTGQILTVTAEA